MPQTLKPKQTNRALQRHLKECGLKQSRQLTDAATELSIKLNIGIIDAYDLLSKMGQYMCENPGVKKNGNEN